MWRRKSIASQFGKETVRRIFRPSTALLPGIDPISDKRTTSITQATVTNEPEQTGSSQSDVVHGDDRVIWLCLVSLAVSLTQTARMAGSSPRPVVHASLGLFAKYQRISAELAVRP